MQLRQLFKELNIKAVLRHKIFARISHERRSDELMKAVLKWRGNVKRRLDSAKQMRIKRGGKNLLEIGIQDEDIEVKNRDNRKQAYVAIF